MMITTHYHSHYLQFFVPYLAIGVGLFYPLFKNSFLNLLSTIKLRNIWAITIFFTVIFCMEILLKDFVYVYYSIYQKKNPIYPKIEKLISIQPEEKRDFLFLNDERMHWILQEPRYGFPTSANTAHIIDWGTWDNKFDMPKHFNHPTNAKEYCKALEERGPTIIFIRDLPNFKKSCLKKSDIYNLEENLSDNVSLFKRYN